MSDFRLSEQAEAELDGIWLYVARETGSIETADTLIDSIADRFWFLARHPCAGRQRDHDLRPGIRSFPAKGDIIICCIEDECAVILHIPSWQPRYRRLLSPLEIARPSKTSLIASSSHTMDGLQTR